MNKVSEQMVVNLNSKMTGGDDVSNEDMNMNELKNALEQCIEKADELFLSLVAIRLSEALDILDADSVTLEPAKIQVRSKPRRDT